MHVGCAGAREEALRLERRQGFLDPPPPALAEAAPRTDARQQLRHRLEVEHPLVRGAERRLQHRLGQGRLRARVVGAQDVAEADDQLPDALASDPRLVLLHGRPGVAQEARRQRGIAVGDLAVDLERVADPARVVQERPVPGWG